MIKMSLREELHKMVTQGFDNSLSELLKISGIKPVSKRKDDMVNALYDVLSKEENIYYIWEALPKYDREVLEEFIRSEGHPDFKELNALGEKYKVKTNSYGYLSDRNYIPKDSKINLFFINRKIPKEISDVLKKYIKPIEIKYTPVELDEEFDNMVCIGESFEQDFTNVIKLISTQKLKAVKSSGLPNKQAAIKLEGSLFNKEILPYSYSSIDYIRVLEDTTRIYGISNLLKQANVITAEKDNLILGGNAKEFLREGIADKCSRLLEAYTASTINELERIKEIKITAENYSGLKKCRKLILEFISKVPLNQWIDIEEIKHFIKKTNNRFLEKAVGDICSYSEEEYEYRWQRNQDWDDIEGRLIEVMMLEYLSAIGVVDIVYSHFETDYGKEYIRVTYFRFTQLGAYVLGASNEYSYKTSKEKSGLIVHEDLTVSITEGQEKQLHEIFLESVSERVSENEGEKYSITFKSLAGALDEGMAIREVIDYLIDNSLKEIPEEALSTLIHWEELSKKIKIRKITIMETDSEELYNELKSCKPVRSKLIKEIKNSFELDKGNVTAVKRHLEKKGYFCVLEKEL
jgi:hypothetical protein